MSSQPFSPAFNRRHFLSLIGAATGAVKAGVFDVARAQAGEDPVLAGRPLVRYPEKAGLILLTSRPPQLETPMSYFERAITPNEAFYVRYHTFPPPTRIDLAAWRLRVEGFVEHPLELSMDELVRQFPLTSFIAVNQCSGNSRGRMSPRVFGGQWGDGAMGNAEWRGVRLTDLLGTAGVKDGAVEVAFQGLDEPAAPAIPQFAKSLTLNQVKENPDILVALEMNGQPLPMLNGFPARLAVPGWFATYWVKHLAKITVLDHEFDSFWMQKAYRIPASTCGCVEPGASPARTVPINRMKVRSFILSPKEGARVSVGHPVIVKGIAFDGGYGIAEVEISADEGSSWRRAALGKDLGNYSFREWSAQWTPARRGNFSLMARAVNRVGESQPFELAWNPSGYMRNVIEKIHVSAL